MLALGGGLALALAEPHDMDEESRRQAIADHPARYAILHPAADGVHQPGDVHERVPRKIPVWKGHYEEGAPEPVTPAKVFHPATSFNRATPKLRPSPVPLSPEAAGTLPSPEAQIRKQQEDDDDGNDDDGNAVDDDENDDDENDDDENDDDGDVDKQRLDGPDEKRRLDDWCGPNGCDPLDTGRHCTTCSNVSPPELSPLFCEMDLPNWPDADIKDWCAVSDDMTKNRGVYCFHTCWDHGYAFKPAISICCESCSTCSNVHPSGEGFCEMLSDLAALSSCTDEKLGWQKRGYCTRTCAQKITDFSDNGKTPACCKAAEADATKAAP